jgi:uncharacterized protein DUF6049
MKVGPRPWLRVAPQLAAMVATTIVLPTPEASAEQAPPAGVSVVLDQLTPTAPKANTKLVLKGHVVNDGPGTLHNAAVSLLLRHRRLSTRGELRTVAEGADVTRESVAVPGTDHPLGTDLPAGASATWSITVPMKDLQLPAAGVYVLTVVAVGERGIPALPGDHRVGSLSTFLPYLPDPKGYAPTEVSWLWPLAGVPDRDGTGAFTTATPSAVLGPGQRLADLATAPGQLPVTWLIDPDLLDAAAALAGPHRREDRARTLDDPADPVAAGWLSGLRSQLAQRPVAALPYADPDVSALAHAGYGDALTQALDRSRADTTAVLGRESDTTLAVPGSGLADPATLSLWRRSGARTVVLSGAEFPALASVNHTPTGRAGIDTGAGHLEALIADVGLGDAISGDLRAPGAVTVAQQRLLGDLAMITLERPHSQRVVLISPPRRWSPAPGGAQRLLAASAEAPWARLTDLATLSRIPVPAELAAATPTYPASVSVPELRTSYVTRLRTSAGDLDLLRTLLAKPGEVIDDYAAGLLRAASVTWTNDPSAATGYLKALQASLRAEEAKVRVVGRDLVTMSSSHGTIPLTVSNELDQAVRVRPVLRSIVTGRLRAQTPDLLTIPAGRKVTLRVPAEAAANGITRVQVELLDADGHRVGTPMALRVNVTNYGSVGLIVVLGAGGLLFATAIVRNVRRVRRARDANRTAGGAPSAEVAGGERVKA